MTSRSFLDQILQSQILFHTHTLKFCLVMVVLRFMTNVYWVLAMLQAQLCVFHYLKKSLQQTYKVVIYIIILVLKGL